MTQIYKTNFPGTISISRRTSGVNEPSIAIEVKDAKSRLTLIEVEVTPEVFGNIVTGLSEQEAFIESVYVGPHIGKTKEVKTVHVEIPKRDFTKDAWEDLALKAVTPDLVDGWSVQSGALKPNGHKTKYNPDGSCVFGITLVRWVDTAGE